MYILRICRYFDRNVNGKWSHMYTYTRDTCTCEFIKSVDYWFNFVIRPPIMDMRLLRLHFHSWRLNRWKGTRRPDLLIMLGQQQQVSVICLPTALSPCRQTPIETKKKKREQNRERKRWNKSECNSGWKLYTCIRLSYSNLDGCVYSNRVLYNETSGKDGGEDESLCKRKKSQEK